MLMLWPSKGFYNPFVKRGQVFVQWCFVWRSVSASNHGGVVSKIFLLGGCHGMYIILFTPEARRRRRRREGQLDPDPILHSLSLYK